MIQQHLNVFYVNNSKICAHYLLQNGLQIKIYTYLLMENKLNNIDTH